MMNKKELLKYLRHVMSMADIHEKRLYAPVPQKYIDVICQSTDVFKPHCNYLIGFYQNAKMSSPCRMFYLIHPTGRLQPIPISSFNSTNARKHQRYRAIVDDQMRAERRKRGLWGKPELHLDHIYPFHQIVKDYEKHCAELGKKPTLEGFAFYHKETAKYQVLTARENMSKGGRVSSDCLAP
jgi:hypothetical protein